MHTIGRDGDGTWWVARMEVHDSVSMVNVMFKGMTFGRAALLCNYLNGGGKDITFFLDKAEECAV